MAWSMRSGSTVAIETVVNEDDSRELRVTGADLGLLVGPHGWDASRPCRSSPGWRPGATASGAASCGCGSTSAATASVAGMRWPASPGTLAEEVRASGVQKVLEPMSSPDRKIVHDAITDVEGVATLSEGEEPRRRVVIVPQPLS